MDATLSECTFEQAMKQVGASDLALSEATGVHRTEIWAYRTKGRVPKADRAQRLVAALRKLGATFTEIIWK